MIRSRLLFSASFVFLAFLMVVISALRLAQPELLKQKFSKPVFAIVMPEATSAAKLLPILATPSANLTSNYILPYPGILPDHPLYWLKMIRDKINLLMTQDPLAKFELYLLYADKRLGAGQVLIIGNQPQLGATTISKGEKYLLKAWDQLKQIMMDKEVDPQIKEQFAQAFLKHQEIIKEIQNQAPESEQTSLQESLNLNKSIFESHINQFLPQSQNNISDEKSATASSQESKN